MVTSHLSSQFRALNRYPNHNSYSSSSITLLQPCKFSSISLPSSPKLSRSIKLCASTSDKATSFSSSNSKPTIVAEAFRGGFLQFQDVGQVELGRPGFLPHDLHSLHVDCFEVF